MVLASSLNVMSADYRPQNNDVVIKSAVDGKVVVIINYQMHSYGIVIRN
jgi:hypothetical protein